MKTFTKAEVLEILHSVQLSELSDDFDGQLMFYTGIYQWADGTLRDLPENDESEDL